jgi:hypothetical protein
MMEMIHSPSEKGQRAAFVSGTIVDKYLNDQRSFVDLELEK